MSGRETFIGQNKPMDVNDLSWTPQDDWSGTAEFYSSECSGECFPWRKIDWTRDSSGRTCEFR